MAIQYFCTSADLSVVVRYEGQELTEDKDGKKVLADVTKVVQLRVADLGRKNKERYFESGKVEKIKSTEGWEAVDPLYWWHPIRIEEVRFDFQPENDAPDLLDCFLMAVEPLRDKQGNLKDALPPGGVVEDCAAKYRRKGLTKEEAWKKACEELVVYQTKCSDIFIKTNVPEGTEWSYPDSYLEAKAPEPTVKVLKKETKKVKVAK